MKTNVLLWIVALGFLTSCVDDKYNLGDIGDVTIGDEWVAPLGTGEIKVTDVVDFSEVGDNLQIDAEGNYSMHYEGKAEIVVPEIADNPGLSGIPPLPGISISEVEFNLVDLKTIFGDFGDDFVLGLNNPHLIIGGEFGGTGTVKGNMKLIPVGGTNPLEPIETPYTLTESKESWIGPIDPKEPTKYFFYENHTLPQWIESWPELLKLNATITEWTSGITSFSALTYTLGLPFIPSAAFKATVTETIQDAFDDSFVDYVFSSGDVTIFGTFDNELPFNIAITMKLTDAEGKDVGIVLPSQAVNGTGPQEVAFKITKADMPKMKGARNIEMLFSLSGRPNDAAWLNEHQKMTMNLKLKKEGGIKL